jgi:biopolymer transport protein ExbD
MTIHAPGKVLLHHIPLKFVHDRVAGGGRKSTDVSIALVPFIDFLIVLVVFLLSSFSASGELLSQRPNLRMPSAVNAEALELAPIVAIDALVVTLDNRRVADTPSLAQNSALERVEQLVTELQTVRRNWEVLHPRDDFTGTVIIQADENIDFTVLKQIMASCAAAGYAQFAFAVNLTGGG